MKNERINVIIPFVNEKFKMEKCLFSLLNQTYKFFNLLFINNGVKNNETEVLIKETLKKYINYKILFEDKKGVCYARNKGLKNIEYGYVLFIDADDNISLDFIENAQTTIPLKKNQISRPYMNYFDNGNEYLETDEEIIKRTFDICFLFYWNKSKMTLFDEEITFNEAIDFLVSNNFDNSLTILFFGIYKYNLQNKKEYTNTKDKLMKKHPNNEIINSLIKG